MLKSRGQDDGPSISVCFWTPLPQKASIDLVHDFREMRISYCQELGLQDNEEISVLFMENDNQSDGMSISGEMVEDQ